jgi:type VI secretion system protein ImpF
MIRHPGASRPPTASLLDRLIDDAPFDSIEPQPTRPERARALLESIRRDLEVLFNTRRPLMAPPDGAGDALDQSVVGYGLPSSRGTESGSTRRLEGLRQAIEGAIRRFEPRLTGVKVIPEKVTGPPESIAIVVTARLAGDLDFGLVSLRSSLDPLSGRLGFVGAAT